MGVDVVAIRGLRGPEGAGWQPVTNPHVQAQLPARAVYYLLNGSGCDCQSALVRSGTAGGKELKLPRAAARWTETKRMRWLEQRGVIAEGKEASARGDAIAWFEYLKRVVVLARKGPVGLLIHFYSGGPDNERLTIAHRVSVKLQATSASVLQTLESDILYEFS